MSYDRLTDHAPALLEALRGLHLAVTMRPSGTGGLSQAERAALDQARAAIIDATRVEVIECTIGQHFATLVEYGDTEGLTGREVRAFQAFEQSMRDNPPEGYEFTHWSIDTDDADEFAECEVTGLRGGCFRFDAVYFLKGHA